ncbi:uncharacterized protein LOC124396014 [Silurus meridionalis]|uniref:uncharacterized protein LOC124396014 n=1 Tax=Silurus meridionalis TaxID=175797 RepID=UPI001EEAFB2E|nr:uncharacterized protein LOC124396014 [Silurus meridionalis]
MRRPSHSNIIQETPWSQMPKLKITEAGMFQTVEEKITRMNRALLKSAPLNVPEIQDRTSIYKVNKGFFTVNAKNTMISNYLALPILSGKNRYLADKIIEEVHREFAEKNTKKSKRCKMDPIGFSPFKPLLREETTSLEEKMPKKKKPVVRRHLKKHEDGEAFIVDEDTHITRTTDEGHQLKEKITDDSLKCLTFGDLNKQLTQYILGKLEGKAAKIVLQTCAQKEAKRFQEAGDQARNILKHACYVPSTHFSKTADCRRRTRPVKVRLVPNIYATNLEYMVHQKENLEQVLRIRQLAPTACQQTAFCM